MISATQLYDFVHCQHRVSMDAFGDAVKREETSPFVELLWEQGLVHENAIAERLATTANMKLIDLADRERETRAAMARHEPLIFGGRLTAGDLVGEPDLLYSCPGMMRFMNLSKSGTVKAVSPWVGLQIMPFAIEPARVGLSD